MQKMIENQLKRLKEGGEKSRSQSETTTTIATTTTTTVETVIKYTHRAERSYSFLNENGKE